MSGEEAWVSKVSLSCVQKWGMCCSINVWVMHCRFLRPRHWEGLGASTLGSMLRGYFSLLKSLLGTSGDRSCATPKLTGNRGREIAHPGSISQSQSHVASIFVALPMPRVSSEAVPQQDLECCCIYNVFSCTGVSRILSHLKALLMHVCCRLGFSHNRGSRPKVFRCMHALQRLAVTLEISDGFSSAFLRLWAACHAALTAESPAAVLAGTGRAVRSTVWQQGVSKEGAVCFYWLFFSNYKTFLLVKRQL